MQLPAIGFPQATLATDSRADVALPTGATNWFGENTPPGLRYGSSRDQAYVNLRPRADNPTSPSTSTYTFDRATPVGWTFVLGDIDSDQVAVSATRADGTAATVAELGFRTAFNLCATTPRPSSVCSTTTGRPQDVPTWDPVTAILRGNDGATDTDGATGWFEPTVPLRTLTLTFTRRAGLPIFQTWFAVTKQDVTGTVAAVPGATCDPAGAAVSLLDRSGEVLAERTIGAAGTYSFVGVAASDGYRVLLSGLPADCIVNGSSSRPIDLRAGDASVGFAVRDVVPFPISGRVTDGPDPVEGVVVTLTPAGGAPRTTTTDADGRYLFDDNADTTDYTIEVSPPVGYENPGDRTFTLSGAPEIVDFALQALPSVSGIVEDVDGPVAGVTVELTGNGQIYRAVTGADGTYVLPGLPAGGYSLTVPNPPAGYLAAPVLTVTVGSDDVDDQVIELTRVPATGSVAGVITLDGAPVAGVVVTIRPPGGTGQDVATDVQGTYGLGGLAPGAYEIVVTPPGGTTGGAARTITITSAGEEVLAQDFALTTAATPVVPPTPAPAPSPAPDPADPDTPPDDPGASPGDDGGAAQPAAGVLPDAGGPAASIPLLGLGLLVAGGVAVAAARPRRS